MPTDPFDALPNRAKTALTEAQRMAAIGEAQRRIASNYLWVPIARESHWVAAAQRMEGARAHGIYGIGLYKGPDIRLTR